MLSLNHGVYIIEKGYKKTVCPDGKYFHQNKLFFIFTLIIFSEHSYFLRKSQITLKRKQRKKIFFNSICTPLEHPDSPQSLYLWAFSQFSPLLKLAESGLIQIISIQLSILLCIDKLHLFHTLFFISHIFSTNPVPLHFFIIVCSSGGLQVRLLFTE